MPRAVSLAGLAQRASSRTLRRADSERAGGAPAPGFSQDEEEFFREGDAMSQVDDFRDLDDGHAPTTLWRALLGWLRGERTASGG